MASEKNSSEIASLLVEKCLIRSQDRRESFESSITFVRMMGLSIVGRSLVDRAKKDVGLGRSTLRRNLGDETSGEPGM